MILLLLCETRQRQALTALAGNRFLWIHSWGRCGLRPAAPSASSFDFSKKPRGQAPPFPSQNGGLDPTMLVRMLRNVFHALWKNAADWETGQGLHEAVCLGPGLWLPPRGVTEPGLERAALHGSPRPALRGPSWCQECCILGLPWASSSVMKNREHFTTVAQTFALG